MPAKIPKAIREARLRSISRLSFLGWESDEFGSKSRVVMSCEAHDHIWTTSVASLEAGGGCPQCARIAKSEGSRTSMRDCESKLSELKGIEFVRWETGYSNCNSKAVMHCTIHKHDWSASVSNLLYRKSGCPKCGGVYRYAREEVESILRVQSGAEFVGWRDGSYKNANSFAVMVCTSGHIYAASASRIINRSHGCMECTGRKRIEQGVREKQLSTLDGVSFIRWEKEYRNQKSKAVMKCGKCSLEWAATVNCLMDGGSRCPSCAKYGFDPSKPGALYALRSECGRYVKIGISNNSKKRIRELKRATPFEFATIEQLHFELGADARALEVKAHATFESAGFEGYDGATEWVIFTPALPDWLSDKRQRKAA